MSSRPPPSTLHDSDAHAPAHPLATRPTLDGLLQSEIWPALPIAVVSPVLREGWMGAGAESWVWVAIMRHGAARRTGSASAEGARGTSLTEAGSPLQLNALDPAGWPSHTDQDARTRWGRFTMRSKTDSAALPGAGGRRARSTNKLAAPPSRRGGGGGQPGAGPLPLARGELAMLGAPEGEPLVLRWVLSPSDPVVVEELKEKIRSRMESAKLLGAFVTALLLLAADPRSQ